VNEVASQAIRYARAGLRVLPVSGKLPLTKNGLTDATDQESKIAFWFRHYAGAGVAIACGDLLRTGGFLAVLDVDPKHDGDASLEELEGEHGALPPTWTVRTPSGGWHYWFRTREPHPTHIGFRPGLEIRGVGAYVVTAPSPGYEIEAADPPAPAPAWLLDAAKPAPTTGPAPTLDETIPKGRRDHTLASLAGTLRRRGLVADEILVCLSAVNARRCDPPLPERDLVRIAKSIARKPAGRPLTEQYRREA
jgi:putative DNA primase/helicase